MRKTCSLLLAAFQLSQRVSLLTHNNLLPRRWVSDNAGLWENYYQCNNQTLDADTWIGDWPPTVPGCDTCTGPFPWNPVECKDCKDCDYAHPDKIVEFIAIDAASVGFWITVELMLLGTSAVKCACRIAAEYNYRLYPLNAERAFVANALIRPCFEMGNPKSPVLSVDPEVESNAKRRLRIFAVTVIYAGKIFFVSGITKVILKLSLSVPQYTWTTSYAPILACCFWDTLIFSVAMEHVAVVASGISTAPEVFNEIMRDHELNNGLIQKRPAVDNGAPSTSPTVGASVEVGGAGDDSDPKTTAVPLWKVQCVRAVGVAIVLKGSMHPAMELLLRHAIQYFGLKGSEQVHGPGSLDSIPRFLDDMRKLTPRERKTVLKVHLLAETIDGALNKDEKVVWQRIALVMGSEWPQGADIQAMEGVACLFRNGETLTARMLEEALDNDQGNNQVYDRGWKERLWFKVRTMLLK